MANKLLRNLVVWVSVTVLLLLSSVVVYVAGGWQKRAGQGGHFIRIGNSVHYNLPKSLLLADGRVLISDSIFQIGGRSGSGFQIFDPISKLLVPVDLASNGFFPVRLQTGSVLLLGRKKEIIYNFTKSRIDHIGRALPELGNIYAALPVSGNQVFIAASDFKANKFLPVFLSYNWRNGTYQTVPSELKPQIGQPCIEMEEITPEVIFIALTGTDSSTPSGEKPSGIRMGLYNASSKKITWFPSVMEKDNYGCPAITKLSNKKIFINAQGRQSYIIDPGNQRIYLVGPGNYEGHGTATLLRDGKVLLTGGRKVEPAKLSGWKRADCFWSAGAELFNPENNTFTKVNNLQVSRKGHTATALPDGSVLIVGGENTFQCDEVRHTGSYQKVTDMELFSKQ